MHRASKVHSSFELGFADLCVGVENLEQDAAAAAAALAAVVAAAVDVALVHVEALLAAVLPDEAAGQEAHHQR